MKKVIIIGAGPAGLTATHELLTQSKDYMVLCDLGNLSEECLKFATEVL